MADLYVKETFLSPDVEPANGATSNSPDDAIREADFVTRESGGGCHLTDPSGDTVPDGIVPHRQRGDHLRPHTEDYSDPVYEGSGSDLDADDAVPIVRLHDGMLVMPYTIRDENASAPSISKNDVVGIIFGPGNRPVLVEEGYTDDFSGSSTTYNVSNGNFIALGEAETNETGYEEQVPVRVKGRQLNRN